MGLEGVSKSKAGFPRHPYFAIKSLLLKDFVNRVHRGIQSYYSFGFRELFIPVSGYVRFLQRMPLKNTILRRTNCRVADTRVTLCWIGRGLRAMSSPTTAPCPTTSPITLGSHPPMRLSLNKSEKLLAIIKQVEIRFLHL